MTRANRVAVQAQENGYLAVFYRTHKEIARAMSTDTKWEADPTANSTSNRESYRTWICEHAEEFGVEWIPAMQTQAWDRKHAKYMSDADVGEDAIVLMADTIARLADKGKYPIEISGMEMTDIQPMESSLGYVEDGKYTKDGAWCVADIEITINGRLYGQDISVIYHMAMKSGQICKCNMKIADWNEIVGKEMELCGIEIPADTKTA